MADCAEKKMKGTIRVRTNQFETIVEAMEKNFFLNEGKLTNTYTALKRNRDWVELAQKLNSSGGAVKNIKGWQKSWSDKKGDVKKKNSLMKAARLKTGGGSAEVKSLTPLEERILNLIGLDAAEGLLVEESEENIIPNIEEEPDSLLMNSFSLLTSTQEYILPDSEAATQSVVENSRDSPPPTTQTPRSTPHQSRDDRLSSHTKRIRAKPVILKSQHSQKLVDGTADMASAFKRCAEAMEQQNILRERELVIQKQKADAISGIWHLLQRKLK